MNATIHQFGMLMVISVVAVTLIGLSQEKEPVFGGKTDIIFAKQLWKAMDGYRNWPIKSKVSPGKSPHGKFIKLYYNITLVDGKPYHVIIKDNYGGKNVTMKQVTADPAAWLKAITVMVQREPGYNSDDADWYWVKYNTDGSIDKNPMGMMLAGRVAKGSDKGCIACHSAAEGNDYYFTND